MPYLCFVSSSALLGTPRPETLFLLWKTPQVYKSREDGTINCCVFSIHVYQLWVHGRFHFISIHQSLSLDSFKQIPNISVLCSPETEPAEFCEEASRDLSSRAAFLLVFFLLASFAPAPGVQGTASSCAFLGFRGFNQLNSQLPLYLVQDTDFFSLLSHLLLVHLLPKLPEFDTVLFFHLSLYL